MAARQRLDKLVLERGLAPSREKAQALIMAGQVIVGDHVADKAGQQVAVDAEIRVRGETLPFVSRGGLKLRKALDQFGVDVSGLVALDVGASTGGFTDCLLQAGARHVVGVDVGHGQLHPKLAADKRVTAIEGINCRALTAADLGDALPEGGFDLIVGDVSFISMALILPQLLPLLAQNGEMLLLIKPQFEVGPTNIGKGGIVRNTALYRDVERKFADLARISGLTVADWLDSPITGGDGNREFFIWLKK